jgi:hypothetical protein
MKSDVFHAYDPTSVRESSLGIRFERSNEATNDSSQANMLKLGYKPSFSTDLARFSAHLEARNDDILGKATHDATVFCRACPQYGHALIFPRKCYYEAQCPLPLLFCAEIHHGEKAVRTSFHGRVCTHPTQNFLRRLSSTLSKKIAYNDPTRENTNFGWRRKQ